MQCAAALLPDGPRVPPRRDQHHMGWNTCATYFGKTTLRPALGLIGGSNLVGGASGGRHPLNKPCQPPLLKIGPP